MLRSPRCIGDQVGYAFGKKVGPSIFRRPELGFFKQEYVNAPTSSSRRHGAKTILLARFVPVVRTFVPILAGVGKMRYRTFLIYNVIGGFVWAVGVTSLGYLLGDQIGADNIDKYLLPIIAVVIFLSILPAVHRGAAAPAQGAEAHRRAPKPRPRARAPPRGDRRVRIRRPAAALPRRSKR